MITIRLFAVLRERAGQEELQIRLPGGTVADVLREVSRMHPALAGLVSADKVIVAVNQELVRSDAPVRNGDEVALMPPFSGGDERTGHVAVQREPFSIGQEVERLKAVSPNIGGIVTFLGTTRDLSRGKAVSKLEFEHYPGMAEKKLGEIRERAIREFGAIDATIIHRVGTLPVGENIVLIVTAAMHREEAFAACRYCIDELKRITPIWKKETTPEGEVWVEEHP